MASAKEFVQSPSMEVLQTFKKDMLMQVAQELQLEVKRSMRKQSMSLKDLLLNSWSMKTFYLTVVWKCIKLYQWNLLANLS